LVVNLSHVQGNILKAFGKPNMLLSFFEFQNPDAAKSWLREIAEKLPSSQDVKDSKNEPWIHISLSAKGIKKLGLTLPPSRDSLHPEDFLVDDGDPFAVGMKSRSDVLGDSGNSDPKQWKQPFDSDTIDGVLIIASDNEDEPERLSDQIKEGAQKMQINFIGNQKGKGLKENGKDIEHFGFRDGISQPLVRGINDDKIAKLKDPPHQIPSDPEDFVLSGFEDNLSWVNEGSFLVYRRLQQDVDGFWDFMNSTATSVGMSPEKLAAKFVGRWKSGASLAKNDLDSDPGVSPTSDDNDFTYMEDDADGKITPRFSHIRKSFPRGDGVFDSIEKNKKANNRHRMLRRGIPYGTKQDKDKGLLFMCYQKKTLQCNLSLFKKYG